jgi:hypothetical protein
MRRTIETTLIVLILAAAAWAQTVSVAQIRGTVKDVSGAALPGAEIKVTQIETGLVRNVLSDETGTFTLPNLPIGPYKLEVSLPGFSTYVQTGIVLQVNSNPTIPVVLQIGAVSQTIEVAADAAMVETQNNSVGQVIDQRRIVELPLNGRQATQLILLSGAAVTSAGGGIITNKNYPSAVAISVAGGQGNTTTFLLDGGFSNDVLTNVSLPLPFPDALQEFKVETSAVPARYGIHPGATVNAVTKTGSNELHGSMFEFVRNSALNARNPFALKSDGLKRNQFGGALGGPIVKQRVFFFGGYQGTLVRTVPTDALALVPTAAMRAGDFTAAASPLCNGGRQITLGDPFVNNQISPALFSKPAVNLLKYVPVSSDPCGQIRYGISNNYNEHQFIGRADYQRSDKHAMFARYFAAKYYHPPAFDGTNILQTNAPGMGLDNLVQTVVLADTYTFSPNFISSFRASVARSRILRFHSDKTPTYTDLGVNIFSGYTGGSRSFFNLGTITNGFGGPDFPGYFNTTAVQISEDIDIIRGRHQITFGANVIPQQLNALGPFLMNGQFGFNGQRVGQNRVGLADFMLGLPSSFRQANGQIMYERQTYLGAYVQDSWRAGPRLSINAGLRWEPFFPSTSKQNIRSHFETAGFQEGRKSKVFARAPAGILFPGDDGFPGRGSTFGKVAQLAPRVGLVLDPKADGKQTIRASYGMFYDQPIMWYNNAYPQNPPFGMDTTIPNPVSFVDPWQGYPGGNPFPTPTPLPNDITFPQFGNFVNTPLHADSMYMQQWNLSYQKQIRNDWLASISYIGNKTTHLWLGRDINPAVYIPGQSTTSNINNRRRLFLLNPTEGRFYSGIIETDTGANANYNGMLASIQKRFSHGMSWNSNFTLAKCLNDGEANQNIANVYPDPNDRRSNRGPCSADRRRILNNSLLIESPAAGSGALRSISRNWQFSTIFTMQSGSPLTITSGSDNALTGAPGQRPIQIADARISNPTINRWFNTAAFIPNPLGVWGGIGRGTLRGPVNWNLDVALSRRFQFGEGQRIELRAESFNLLNRFRPNDPNTALNNTNFGKITSAQDPRIMQFAAKYVF